MDTIILPPKLVELLRQNAQAIERIYEQNHLLLTGYMAGADIDTSKEYNVSDDFTTLTEKTKE